MESNELKENISMKVYYIPVVISVFIILFIGISFAWFATRKGDNPNLVTIGTLQIKYDQGRYINASDLKPVTKSQVLEAYIDGSCVYEGDRNNGIISDKICSYNTFTITNTGSLYAKTTIGVKDIVNTYSNNIKYMFFESTPSELIANNLKEATILEDDLLIPSITNNSKTYTLLIWLDENADNNDFNKTYNGNIYAEAVETNFLVEPNAPVLAEGMIPITYNGNNWDKADISNTNNNWYDYENKMWANAVMVTSDTRDNYMNASVGTEILEDDILAYYVWIPRYKYKLFNATYASSTSASLIDVVFESGTASTGTVKCTYSTSGAESCTNKSNGNYYTHPAFTFGSNSLEGIWVGKFETTGSTSSPTIKPGITSLRNITIANMYSTGQLFKTTTYLTSTGVNQVDSRMMKNIEWGAVAYLKQSSYGLGTTDTGKNSNSDFKTGCGATSGSSPSSTCNTYNTTTGMLASTTGNITGVYDMAGGADEYVMGNYNKTAGSSGLTVSGVPSEHIDIYAGDDMSFFT